MKRIIILITTSFLTLTGYAKTSGFADDIYFNGKIYTVNESQPWVKGVAIQGGKFIKVGSSVDVLKLKGPKTKVHDLKESFVMPGIIDTHIHAGLLMGKRAFCALPGTFSDPTEKQTLEKLKECIANYPKEKKWFIAHGFSTPVMNKNTLTRKVLDRLIPDKPAYIEDESGHNAWFNTKAMELAKVDKSFKDNPESFFSRTTEGDLAGVAYEGAMNPFLKVLPKQSIHLLKNAYLKLINEANAKGITAFGDAYVFDKDLPVWQALKKENKITAHVILYLKGNLGTDELTPVKKLLEMYSKYDLPGHKAVKIGMGGAIESYSESLVDGYKDPTKKARPIIGKKKFAEYISKLDKAGFQVKIHAVGDGSVRAVLDGYEVVIKKNGNNRLRHHIDHCSLVHPSDFKRFVELDVSCTIWPPLNAPINYNISAIKPVLKNSTWNRMYPNRDMLASGMKLTNHTDAPAAVLWPWWGMEASITRSVPGKPEKGVLGKNQALNVKELIKIYTINSAWSLHLEKKTGSIEEGKSADMIILNHNLLTVKPVDLHKTKVLKTIFKGREIYKKDPT